MFIETLEFTIPVDLCDLFSTLKRGPRSNLEFPASVNSYGTTQDANIQVALRSNKLTFKVDGVSSNSSMISKSECKTLKLSVFDVDCSLAPAEQPNIIMSMSENIHHSVTHKRSYDFSVPVSSPAPKSRRISEPVQSRHIPQPQPQNTSRPSNNSESKSAIDPPVNVKQEPEDPDLIEIEPDSELNDIVPKKETPYMQIDFSSGVPHTQTSQAALDRLSHQQSSHSQSPASSSSSFHQNVPHVPDYAEPSTSQVHHGDQSADDFLVFQEDNDYGDDNDNEADYSNDGFHGSGVAGGMLMTSMYRGQFSHAAEFAGGGGGDLQPSFPCPHCDRMFMTYRARTFHVEAIHQQLSFACVCGKIYKYRSSLHKHLRQNKMCAAGMNPEGPSAS
ncbi:transcription activator MSS11-like isoform X26 [Haliotis rufescens]|uniref:transcription activator MSS11-like isoform X26 n=1 Tax=Haliotis rufescens TaxID=6454 RepID=UPI00201EFA74|nr:transcription activator MSS11-like isoform X26 [Haliotis rufescens]